MDAKELHNDCIVIDCLGISRWSRSDFEDMRKSGLTTVNSTCTVLEGVRGAMNNIARWKRWFDEHSDIILQFHSTQDFR